MLALLVVAIVPTTPAVALTWIAVDDGMDGVDESRRTAAARHASGCRFVAAGEHGAGQHCGDEARYFRGLFDCSHNLSMAWVHERGCTSVRVPAINAELALARAPTTMPSPRALRVMRSADPR